MKYLFNALVALLLMLVIPAFAAETPVPAPPKVEARAHVLLDADSGQILAESNSDAAMEPASLAKIMTAYVAADELKQGNIKLEDEVLVSENAWRTWGSRTFIKVGNRVPIQDLLMGVIVQSGNDASVALAEHISGSEGGFAELMNQHVAGLGLKGTHFTNSTGLPEPSLYTTSRDLAFLSVALIRNFPEIYEWFKVPQFTYNGIKQYNRNRLLRRDPTVDGIKTGHTASAGYCLVASAKRDEMRLISVVLGAPNEKARTTGAQALLNYGFLFYETHRLYRANQPLTNVRIWKGGVNTADLGINEDLYITLPRSQHKDINTTMDIIPQVIAPVAKGEQQGILKVTLGDKELLQRPLVLLQSVEEGGILDRLIDQILLYFQ